MVERGEGRELGVGEDWNAETERKRHDSGVREFVLMKFTRPFSCWKRI